MKEARLFCCLSLPSLLLCPAPSCYFIFLAALPFLPYLPRYLTRPVTLPSQLPYPSYLILPATLPLLPYPPRYLTFRILPSPLPYLSCLTLPATLPFLPYPSRYLTLPATYPFHYLILPAASPFLLPYPPSYLTLLAASVSPLHETATQCPGGWRLCGGLCAAVDCPWIQ